MLVLGVNQHQTSNWNIVLLLGLNYLVEMLIITQVRNESLPLHLAAKGNCLEVQPICFLFSNDRSLVFLLPPEEFCFPAHKRLILDTAFRFHAALLDGRSLHVLDLVKVYTFWAFALKSDWVQPNIRVINLYIVPVSFTERYGVKNHNALYDACWSFKKSI